MDVRNRYRRDKCCGMRVEKACYIFAIINVVIVFLFALSCIGLEGYIVTRGIIGLAQNNLYLLRSAWDIYPVHVVLCVSTAVFGMFAVLLLQGIRLNKPKLVMAYLYFGIIVETAMICATVISSALILVFRNSRLHYEYGLICGEIALAIVTCVVYGYILCLVRSTYLVLVSRKQNTVNGQTMLYILDE